VENRAERTSQCSGLIRWLFLLLGLLSFRPASAQTNVILVLPDADAFVSAAAPANNYGGGGGLSVSGSSAVNGLGEQGGLFDTLMRFSLSNAVVTFDNSLGAGNWSIAKARLLLHEVAAPNAPIFNRGVGSFQVLWLASDSWIEGAGIPRAPSSNGVKWNDLPSIVNSALDLSLGVFTHSGKNLPISLTLNLRDPFVADIRGGGEVSLHFTAASPGVGFTFNSRSVGSTSERPLLEITASAAPKPRIDSINLSGGSVSVSFTTMSNLTYRLQGSDTLTSSSAWTDLFVVPGQAAPGVQVFQDGITNRQRFYRLSVSP